MPIIRKRLKRKKVLNRKQVYVSGNPTFFNRNFFLCFFLLKSRLWEYGAQASRPLQTLGEMGVTRHIESDMRRSSPFIRSVVKAHGLQQRSNVIGQTFAVFRVDPQKHLLSVVSKV